MSKTKSSTSPDKPGRRTNAQSAKKKTVTTGAAKKLSAGKKTALKKTATAKPGKPGKKLTGTSGTLTTQTIAPYLDAIPDIIYIKDPANTLMFVNEAFRLVFGLNAIDLVGKTMHELADLAPFYRKVFEKLDADDLRWFNAPHDEKTESFVPRFMNTPFIYSFMRTGEALQKTGNAGLMVIGRDTTDATISLHSHQRSEFIYRSLFENAYDPIVIFDPETEIIFEANPAALNLYGFSRETFIGASLRSVTIDPDKGEQILEEAKKTGKFSNLRRRHKNASGDELHLIVSGSMINYNGQQAILGIIKDITEIVYSEEQINLLSQTVEQSPVATLITDTSGVILYVNKSFCSVTGYEPAEVYGKTTRLFNAGKTPKEVYNDLWNSILTGKEWRGVFENKKKNGEHFFESALIFPIKNTAGEIYRFIALKEDITEKRRTLAELKSTGEQLRLFAETTGDCLYRLKFNNLKYEYLSPGITKLTGYTPAEIDKLKFRDLIEEIILIDEDSKKYKDILANPVERKFREFNADYLIRKKDDSLIWVNDHSFAWLDEDGSLIGSVGILSDISDRKNAEVALLRAKNEAEEMNHLKTVFLSNMSHELRTPMVGVLGLTEILESTLEDEEDRRIAQLIKRSSKRLLSTLNLLITFSMLEKEQYRIETRPCLLEKIVNSSIRLLEEFAAEKGLILSYENFSPGIFVMAEEKLLADNIQNIIDNAIKYTEKGMISVSIQTGVVPNMVTVSVKDTGIGIPNEVQKVIFEPFRQGSEGFTRSYEGTGLGLTITKRCVEIFGGNIELVSETGKGSTFRLHLPLAK